MKNWPCNRNKNLPNVKIGTVTTTNGFIVNVGKKSYALNYPSITWNKLPFSLKNKIAESLSFIFTRHIPFLKKIKLNYSFAPPLIQSLFIHGLIHSIPELVIDEEPNFSKTTSEIIKLLYNSESYISFASNISPKLEKNHKTYPAIANMLFTFGKDSLLTFSLLKEIGIKVIPYFISEPFSQKEVKIKTFLIKQFKKELKYDIKIVNNTMGFLRQSGSEMWGWDMLLTGYLIMLIPYIYSEKAGNFFISNEQSTNDWEIDKENYIVNPTFEQSSLWTQNLNNLFYFFSLDTHISSLIEPLHELGITYILHRRYPNIAKFQLSCDLEKFSLKNNRWCENCGECARIYIFLLAIGIDPQNIGFTKSMLAPDFKKNYAIFSEKNLDSINKYNTFCKFSEELFALYICYKRGVKGAIIELFKDSYLEIAEKYRNELFRKYLSIYKSRTNSPDLIKRVLPIFNEEISNFKKEVTVLFSARV